MPTPLPKRQRKIVLFADRDLSTVKDCTYLMVAVRDGEESEGVLGIKLKLWQCALNEKRQSLPNIYASLFSHLLELIRKDEPAKRRRRCSGR